MIRVEYRPSNIVDFEGDAIINSLGRNGNEYGHLCKAILQAADDKDLNRIINSITNEEYQKIFMTTAGKLKCKKIIHIITPLRKDDDTECSNLINAYNAIIKFAIKHNFVNIAIPLIGCGANGYTEYESMDALKTSIGYMQIENNDAHIHISVVSYLKKLTEEQAVYELMDTSERGYNGFLYRKHGKALKAVDCEIFDVIANATNLNLSTYFKADLTKVNKPYDFIEQIIEYKGITATELTKRGSERKMKYNYTQLTFEKIRNRRIDVYRLSFLAKMNLTQTMEFMCLCGIMFSPLDELDRFYLDYLTGDYGIANSLTDLDKIAESNGIDIPKFALIKEENLIGDNE